MSFPEISLNVDQATYDQWVRDLNVWVAETPDAQPSDAMDAMTIYALAHRLGQLQPKLMSKLVEHTPAAVRASAQELGLFMGATNLAQLIGADPEFARQVMVQMMKGEQ